ncbi:phosphomevalonate kinase [Candidatus Heimdallarchaeota archaeon B3_Heim]|nr:MAG: phosphomevalonate kinase [Candidatus Heimdallarchaeota archaeon B3_Heim]
MYSPCSSTESFSAIQPDDHISIRLNDFNLSSKCFYSGGTLSIDSEDTRVIFTKYAIESALRYLEARNIPIQPFHLKTWGDISSVKNEETGKEMKVGFGSSAAAVVAIIGAVIQYHSNSSFTQQDKEAIFKLSIISHYLGQGKLGSGFDVAASTFGGALIYRKFDPEWLQQKISTDSQSNLVNEEWPLLQCIPINLPADLVMMVGFTGTSASTKKLVQEMKLYKQKDPDSYYTIISRIADVTEKLIEAIQSKNQVAILKLLDQNRILLEELSFACSCHLEIEAHQIMSHTASKYGAVAKFSGAGGGDCSVGVCFNAINAALIVKEWIKNGIMPIDIEFSSEGMKIEKG